MPRQLAIPPPGPQLRAQTRGWPRAGRAARGGPDPALDAAARRTRAGFAGFAATNLWHKSLSSYPSALLFNAAEEWFAQHPFYGALPALYALSEPGLQGAVGGAGHAGPARDVPISCAASGELGTRHGKAGYVLARDLALHVPRVTRHCISI
jgi:hypothetical protein